MTQPRSPLPKYQQLLISLRQQITTGQLAAGDQLPTEGELSERHQLARGTVRKVIAQLAAEGLVQIEHGVGSFVSQPWTGAEPLRLAEPADPASAGATRYQVLTQELLPAGLELAAQLKIALGAPVIHIAQLRLVRDEVQSYSERYLPEALCPALASADLTRQSVHDVLIDKAEQPPVRAVIEVDARRLAEDDARLLGVAPGTPAIEVNRMSYTAPTRPAVAYRGLFRGQYALSVALLEDVAP